jgi:hypothetical protein
MLTSVHSGVNIIKTDYWVFDFVHYSKENNISETESTSILTDPTECPRPTHLRTETDAVSEIVCSLEYLTMDKVQKLSIPEYYKTLSEPFRIYKWKKNERNF